MRSVYILSITLVALFGCSAGATGDERDKQSEQSVTAEIFSPYGLLGVGIGDTPEAVSEKLGAPSKVVDEEHIYDSQLEGIDHRLYVNYDDGAVFEITLDIFPKDSLKLKERYDQLVSMMDERFQKSSPADGYATWDTGSPTGRLIEVTLADESMENGAPLLMLNFLENYDRSYNAE